MSLRNLNNVFIYGYFYNRLAVMRGANSSETNPSGVQGICPEGWHVPSAAEWDQLINYVGSQSQYVCGSNPSCVAKALAASEGWYSSNGSCHVGNAQTTNNSTGFSARPAGIYTNHAANFSYAACFWSSSLNPYPNSYSWPQQLWYDKSHVSASAFGADNAYSVRCLKDTVPQPCPNAPTLTDYDGNVYRTVQIGNQCWMRENLRTTHFANGDSITYSVSSSSSAIAYYYDYSSSSIPLTERGYLYNWPAVMNGASSSSANPSGIQGICPTGWHVPSYAEWTQLTDYVSSQSIYQCNNNNTYIAKALSSTTYWNYGSSACYVGNTSNTNNSTGFGALPAGYYHGGGYGGIGGNAMFWSATEASGSDAWHYGLGFLSAHVYRNSYDKLWGCSVRCLRD